MENIFLDYWWALFIIPLGLFAIVMIKTWFSMEKKYNPDGTEESSYKCECGYWVYHSSKIEHDKVCGKRKYGSILDD